jgi:ABC-type transporter Mla subunit MlaD
VTETAASAEELVSRVGGVAEDAERIVASAGSVADDARTIVAGAGSVADDASELVQRAAAVADRADHLVGDASGLSEQAGSLLATYRPIAERAAPLATRFVDEFSEEELHAAIRMVDQLPALTEHLESDIMPILATLDRVGPDVHELLDELKGVRQAINGIPGFNFFRRRGEERDEPDRA